MRKEAQIQIPKKAFLDLYKLIIALDNYELDQNTKERVNALEKVIEDKLETMARRTAFTEYKTSEPNTCDRETKRQNYLKLIGLNQDWISTKETFY